MIRPRILAGFDWGLLLVPLLLVAAGISVIYSIAPTATGTVSLAFSQGIYALIGLTIFGIVASLDYRLVRGVAPAIYTAAFVLLFLVLFIGDVQFGARRWIDLGPFQLQPAEFMKLGLVVVLSWYFAAKEDVRWLQLTGAVFLILVPVLLVLQQPDFGSGLLLFFGALPILLLSRISREQWIGLAMAMLVALPIVFFSLQPYQRERLETFLDPTRDPFGAGYNVLQSVIAIGSGGLTGRGLGQGSQSTLQFVPVAHTDFIFAGVAEATGFLGSGALLALFAILIWRAIRLVFVTQDRFGRLLAAGIGAIWFWSVTINVGMNIGLLPVTGIPLPFVSFGGSSLLTNFALAGILASINRRHRKISFKG